jgi:hypothetical protein
MFKNVKIIVLYQNIGGHKAGRFSSTLKNRVGGLVGRVGEEFNLPFNIIYIIGCLSPLLDRFIGGGLYR